MNPYRLFGWAMMAGILFACTTDPAGADGSLPDPLPEAAMHRVSIEAVLADLHSVLESIDGTVDVYDLGGTTWLRWETEDRTLFHCNFGWTSPCDGYYYSYIFDLRKGPEFKDDLVDIHWGEDTDIYNYDTDRKLLIYKAW